MCLGAEVRWLARWSDGLCALHMLLKPPLWSVPEPTGTHSVQENWKVAGSNLSRISWNQLETDIRRQFCHLFLPVPNSNELKTNFPSTGGFLFLILEVLSFRLHKPLFHELKCACRSIPLARNAVSDHTEEVGEVWVHQPLPFADLLPGHGIHTASPTCHYGTQRWAAPQAPLVVLRSWPWDQSSKMRDNEDSLKCSRRQWVFQFLILEDSCGIVGTNEIWHQILDPYLRQKRDQTCLFASGMLQRGER